MLPDIINEDQSTCILGRHVGDNVLLAFELVKHYERSGISPICVIKVDLRNANDSVDWPYLKPLMLGLGFPLQFVSWICFVSVQFHTTYCSTRKVFILLRQRGQGEPPHLTSLS